MKTWYPPAKLKAIARDTASRVGCAALRWWFAGRDRTRLYIEGKHTLAPGIEIVVLLEALVPWHARP